MFKTNQQRKETMQTQQTETKQEVKKDTIKDFIKKQYVKHNNKITIVSEYSDSNPHMNSVESSRMNHYKVTLKSKYEIKGNYLDTRYAHKQMTLFFSQGSGISGEPTLDGVLECLRSDYFCARDGFEEFCANCGYSDDSRKSFKTYQHIQKQSKKLKTFLNNSNGKFSFNFSELLDCEA